MARKTKAPAAPVSESPVSVNSNQTDPTNPNVNQVSKALIVDGPALEKFASQTAKLYMTVSTRVHIAIVSAMYFAAVHGRTNALDTMFNALSSNDKSAVKLYIRRYAAELGLGDKPEGHNQADILAAVKASNFLKHTEKEGWSVISGRGEQRKQWVKLINSRLAEPDAELGDYPVLARNNFASVSILGDSEAIEGIIRAAKRVLEPSERTDVEKVSNTTAKWLQDILDEAERRKSVSNTQGTNLEKA